MQITRLIYPLLFCFFLINIPFSSIAQCGAGETFNSYCYDNGEVNVIAFEFCPSAGMAAESTINQGSFFETFNDNLTVYSGVSGSGTGGSIVFGPSTGNLAGNTVSSLGADQCLIFVINSNTIGVDLSCADGSELELEVCSKSIATSTVNFTALNDLCVNAGVQAGLGGGIPTGGVYSGSGVTDDGNGMTYSFDPAVAGVGVHTLTYTNGASATDDVEVFGIPTVNFTALADLCIDAGIQTGLGGGTPSGGVYSGPGVTDDGNGMTYSFDPAIAGLGVHTITYTEGGVCAATGTDDVEVLAACGCPGAQTTYFHCSDILETDLVVFEICPNAGEFSSAMITQGTYSSSGNNLTVYQGSTGSGTGGTIVLGPQTGDLTGIEITSTVADECLIFVSNTTAVGACQQGFEMPLIVCGESLNDPVFFTAPDDLCINDGIQTSLSGGIPSGGVYSGSGVTDDGNGMTYSFDPAVAGAGVHTITYTEGGNSANDDVEVFAIPTVTYTAPADLCIDAGKQNNLGGGSPIGGVYSGPGVTDNGNGITYSFDPFQAGLGTHTITYTEGGVCMEIATDDIEVTTACSCPSGEVTYFNCYDNNETNLVIFEICPNAGQFAQAEIDQGTYGPNDFLTVYEGPSGSGTGGTIVLGPANGDLAGNNIFASVEDDCLIFVNNTGSIASCADGFEFPLVICGSSQETNILFTALDDLSVNAGVQTGLSGGTPTGGVYSGPGVTDDGNGMTYTFDPAVAGVGVHTLTYTQGGDSAMDDVEVFNLIPPTFSKSFSPNQIGPGSVSTLTFTINNTSTGTGVTDLAFVDNLPAGMTVASPPVITSSCGNISISAIAGSSTISVTDAILGGGESCTISVNVTSSTVGTSTNTTGDLTSSAGNSGTASANLTVADNRPSFSKSFSPGTINLGERSTLTLTIDNTGNTGSLLGITLTDNLPDGMVIAFPSNASSTNTGIGTFTAEPGTSVISYNTTGFTEEVAAGGTCTFSVDVIGNIATNLDNVTENLTVRNNLFQIFDCGKASATLEVLTPSDILIQKSFVTNPVAPGGTTELEFTITNLDRDFDATNISFTDDLTTVLAGLTATGTPLNDVCGVGSQLSGTTLLTFSGGTIPANSSCTFSIPVEVPVSAGVGTYTNVTNPVTADINGSAITGNTATANLFVADVPTFTKTFLNDPIPGGGTTTLEFTITNTSTTSTLSELTFIDPIADFISGAIISNLPAAGSCGAGSLFFTTTASGNPVFQMTEGNIAPGASCTFTIDLTIPTNTAPGDHTNTTSFLSGVIDGGSVSAAPATDDLTVLAIPRLTKSFINDPVDAGDIVDLEFTITYDELAAGDVTNISFTDDLNAVIPGLAAVGLPLNDICGTGAMISGTTNLTFTGGTLSPGGSCTFSVPVQVPAGTVTGTYTNVTSALTSTVGGQSATGSNAMDDLDVGGFTFTKEFIDSPVIPGELTTLRFTFENTSTFDATNIVFTDNLNGILPGLSTEGTLPTGAAACNASTVAGTTFFIYSGGSVDAGTTCSFDIPVRVPANAASGTYTNVTSNLTATIDGATRVLDPAVDDLVVENNLISLTKTFTDDPVSPGGTVIVEYTLTNLDPDNAISNIAFTNDFDAALTGLQATGLPMSVCGGTVSGTGLLSFTGGTLAAGASCTFSVTLQTPANTPFGTTVPCTTSTVTGDLNGLSVIGDAASDNLDFQSLQLSKSFAGSVAPGGTTTLTFAITNFDPVNSVSQITFTDDLDAVIPGMIATALPTDLSLCGATALISGTSVISFGRGELGPGESCSFDVTVMIPCGTMANTYTNVTSTITGDGISGGIEAPAATANLVVTASSNATFTAPADLCIDAGVQAGSGGGTPTGGVYSGTGVTDDGNGMTYSFDPATAGVGVHTLTYSITDGNGCASSASDDIEVFALPTVTFTAPADLCINAGVQAGLGGGTPPQGTVGGDQGVYSGTGVTDDGNGMTYSFDPATAGAGTHTLTYTYIDENGCSSSASDDVEVFALPSVTFTAPADLCIDAGVQAGLGGGTPPEGTAGGDQGVYSGAGVTDDGNGMTYSFDPATAGVGTHTLTYTYMDENGCSASASDDIEVFALPVISFTAPIDGCIDGGIRLGMGQTTTPEGGVFSGPGVTDDGNGDSFTFDPAAAGVGVHILTYTFTDGNGCIASATDNIEIFGLPIVTFTALADLCLNDGVQAGLGGGTPTGGVYSGTGVTDDGNGMTYSFDPAAAGVGTHTLTYTFTDGNGCTNSASDDVEVFALPNVMFTALADLCVNAGVQAGLGGGTPSGGVYSGPGVTDDGNGMTYSFDPASAGVGTHTITYTVGVAGCTDSEMDDVEVFTAPTVTLNIPASQDEYCIDDAIELIDLAGSPTGQGVYSGPGVTDLGNSGISFTFNPGIAGVGTHTVTYTFTDGNGCIASATDDIVVNALPIVTFTALADLCLNDGVQAGLGGGTPTGGVYSGTGVTDDGNGMTYSFDPAAAGVGTHTLTYTFTDGNGCTNSASDDVEVFALPNVMFTALADLCVNAGVEAGLGGGTPSGGVYSGPGVTDDGNGMTYSFDPAAAGVGTHTITYSVGVAGCTDSEMDDVEVYIAPTVTLNIPASQDEYCIDDAIELIDLAGSPTGQGVYSGPGVTDLGNSGISFTFNPGIAGVGTHTVTYTFTDGNGCIASATDDIVVNALPIVTFTALADLCLNDGVQAGLGGGTPTGGVYSGTGVTDDGNGMTYSFDPAAAGVGTHTLTYTFTDGNGCSNSASDDVEVFALPNVMFTALADLCVNAGVQTGLGNGTPSGGVYSGPGVTDDGNGMTYSFDPAAAGVGTHTITYSVGVAGCTDSEMDDVEVFALPTVTLSIPISQYCENSSTELITIAGSPSGGVYSGPGVNDIGDGLSFTFNPAVAGAGTHTITYTFTDGNTCSASATDNIFVTAIPTVSTTSTNSICTANNGTASVSSNGGELPHTYLWSNGSNSANISNLAPGTYTVTVTDAIGCTGEATETVGLTNTMLTVIANSTNSICTANNGTASASATGGTAAYTYVWSNGDTGANISNLAPGTYTVTATDANGCTGSGTTVIGIDDTNPVVNFTALADICIDAGIQAGLGGGTPSEGTVVGDMGLYSGPGVTDDGNGMTYSFDPTTAGIGVHTLTYIYIDQFGCTNSASDMVEVFALPIVTFTAPAPDVCIEDPVVTGLGGGMPTGGVYSGTGVTDDGNGMTFSFDPTASAPTGGNVTVTYTYTDANGCSVSANDDIFVNPICCELIVTCPPTSLGTITCNDAIPMAATDEVSFEALGGNISDDPEQCGMLIISHLDVFDPPTDICNGRTLTRTYTISDDLTSETCTQTLIISAPNGPTITCPANMTVECLSDISVDPANASVTTDCSQGFNTIVTGPVQNGDSDCPGTTYTYTYTVTDDCGRTASCEQVFTIQNTGPTIVCPVDMTVECLSDISVDPADAIVTTSCSLGSNTVITGPVQNGDSDCPGTTYTYTYTVTDDCGRTASCEQVFTIQNVGPTITCPVDMTVECLSDISLDPADATVTTSCTLSSNTVITGPVQNGDSDCPGTTYTYTYTVTDDCGRTASCEQVFTIQNVGPTIVCPANMTVECLSDISLDPADATVTTSCTLGFNTVITGPVQDGASDCPGTTYTYTYTVTDDCGRTASCEQVFTIQNLGPVVTCPADEIVTCEEDIIADPNNLIVEVSCGLTYFAYVEQPLITGGLPGCDGTVYTYTYNVTDECGRVRECQQVFTIQNEAPTISVPADESVACFDDIEVSIDDMIVTADCDGDIVLNVLPPVINGPANCPGTTYTYTYRAKDFCDRITEVERVFTILDSGGPIINAPDDFTSECEVSVNADNAEVITTCGNGVGFDVVVTGPQVIGTPGCSGTQLLYTYTVTDECGQSASDVQTITLDNDGPIIECPNDLVILNCEDGDYNALIEAWIATVTATAHCGGEINVTNDFDEVNGLCISNGFTNVTFIATDECGTTNTCIGTIIITDTEAPTIFEEPEELLVPCNGVTQFIFDNWLATRGGAQAIDGCWQNDITWTMNPANPTLDCDGGPQAIMVEFIATDGCGNSSSVIGTFNTKVQPDMVNVSGSVLRENADPIENVEISIEGGASGIPDIDYTNDLGYGFPELEYEDNLVVVPSKNDDPLNGVTTFDVILLHKHILELDTLDSPYKRIAADINGSGHITSFDIVMLRRLILFIDTEFQTNTSWRFVDADFVFPNPENPFETAFPEVFSLSGLETEIANFVAVKVGDLNLNADPSGLIGDTEDRSGLDDLLFKVEDQNLKTGEEYTIDFLAQNFDRIDGFQFTLNFDPATMELVDLKGEALIQFDEGNYGLRKLEDGAITFSWNHNHAQSINPEEVAFSLLVRAKQDVSLSEVLSISSEFTRAEAYQSGELMNVDLAFDKEGEIYTNNAFKVFQNQPNPFKEATMIGFNLPEAGAVSLEVYDVSGRVIHKVEGDFAKGYNQINLDRSDLPTSGILYYQVNTSTDSDSKKMILAN